MDALRLQATTAEAELKFTDGAIVDLSDSGLVLARARFASIAAGGEVAATGAVDANAEFAVWDTSIGDQLAEDSRLQELIAFGAEEEDLLDEEENGDAQHSKSDDDDAASDTEEMSTGQETAELENNLASTMSGEEDE